MSIFTFGEKPYEYSYRFREDLVRDMSRPPGKGRGNGPGGGPGRQGKKDPPKGGAYNPNHKGSRKRKRPPTASERRRKQPKKPAIVVTNDVWGFPRALLESLQGFPWVQFLNVVDGSSFFPASYELNPAKYDIFRRKLIEFVCGLLVNPPFSEWEKFATFFLNLAKKTGNYYFVIAPNQEKYQWHKRWFKPSNDYTRIDLLTPLAFQKGVLGHPMGHAPHLTSLFIMGLKGPVIECKNDSSGYVYPNIPWLKQIARLNNLNQLAYYQSGYHIPDRLRILTQAADFRKTEDMPADLIRFTPPLLPKIESSTTVEQDSIFSARKRYRLSDFMQKGCSFTSRQKRKNGRTIRTLGEQLKLYPKGPKNYKNWPNPASVPKMCPVCFKRNHPPEKCTKRILTEHECIFSTTYEHYLFRYVTYVHKPYVPLRRPANMGILLWFEKEMTRLQRDAAHFRSSFVDYVRKTYSNPYFEWKEIATYNFSEVVNGIDFWAAIGAPKFLLQRFVNGFRVELTTPDISFEVKNKLPPQKNKELYELHTKPYLEDRKITVVPSWFPQVVFSRFLVEETTKKRPILDCSPMTQFTLCNHFELPPPRSHQNYMPRGYLFGVDATGCFCNCSLRVDDRKYLCFWDEHMGAYLAYTHAAFGFAAGPEYADSLMSPIRDWMRYGFAAALWIDDLSFIWDKLDITAEQLTYMLSMLMKVFEWLKIRLNKKCILIPRMELPFTGIAMNALHCKVFVRISKLNEVWDLIQNITSNDTVTIAKLETLIGKFHWCIGKARPRHINRLQEEVNDYERQIALQFPHKLAGAVMAITLGTHVPTPGYLVTLMHELLRYVENRQFALTHPAPTTWFLTVDTGEDATGGFGYTTTTTTNRFEFFLPENLKPHIPQNDPKETSSGTRELWGLVQLVKRVMSTQETCLMSCQVDNLNVVEWLDEPNEFKMRRECPLRADLLREFYDFCVDRDIEWVIDHHPREQPLARYADWLSKFNSIHKPWIVKNLIFLKPNGLRKIKYLNRTFKLPSASKIREENYRIPWRDLLTRPLPLLQPLQDLLKGTSVVCIPYGLHRNTAYAEIFRNLKRYEFSGFVLCPGYRHALNQAFRHFTTFKLLFPGKHQHFHNPDGEASPHSVKQYAFFMREGSCW